LKRVVAIRRVKEEHASRRYCARCPVNCRAPVGHVLQEAVKRHYIEFADVWREACRVRDNSLERVRIGELLAKPCARNDLRINVDAGDFAAVRNPVHRPCASAASDIQNSKRAPLR
jgi:hypothetical protein